MSVTTDDRVIMNEKGGGGEEGCDDSEKGGRDWGEREIEKGIW